MSLVQKFLDLIFPSCCVFCGQQTDNKNRICIECVKEIPFITEKPCERCGAEPDRCNCTPIVNHYDRVIAPFYYEKAAKKMVLQIKNSGNMQSARVAASFMSECFKRNFPRKRFDIVTQVPTSYTTAVKRGHDHSKILAKLVAKELNLPYNQLLKSKIFKLKQKKLGRLDRLSNIHDKYILSDKDVNGKNIILIDDVKTTGATANECSRILKQNGAKSVVCLALAITARKKCE